MRISDWSSDVCSSDLGVMDETWAGATYTSLATAIMILSIVVITGYAGQISLAQWALAGIGSLIAGRLVRADVPIELAIPLAVLLTIPVGLVFALPALRTRGVNLAVVTLGLGFLVSRSAEHTSELHSLMRISYAVLC